MTLIVNLFAGPGAGKSTMMAEVYAGLKRAGVDAEMAPEFARELVRSGRLPELGVQPFVFGEQLRRLQRLVNDRVECVVTDSPLLLSLVYNVGYKMEDVVWTCHHGFRNMNVFVVRGERPYRPEGRTQTEGEARGLDVEIAAITAMARSYVVRVASNPAGAQHVVGEALREVLRVRGAAL